MRADVCREGLWKIFVWCLCKWGQTQKFTDSLAVELTPKLTIQKHDSQYVRFYFYSSYFEQEKGSVWSCKEHSYHFFNMFESLLWNSRLDCIHIQVSHVNQGWSIRSCKYLHKTCMFCCVTLHEKASLQKHIFLHIHYGNLCTCRKICIQMLLCHFLNKPPMCFFNILEALCPIETFLHIFQIDFCQIYFCAKFWGCETCYAMAKQGLA